MRGRRRWSAGPGLPLAAAICLAWPVIAAAQTEPRLVRAVRLAQEGSGDSARAVVQRVLDATPSTDTLYPQVLYARAVVAANAQDMRRDLQRVTAEYAASTWADRSLLRLAQLDYAGNDLESAARNLERLRLDYPTSPIYAQAALWGGRTYFDLRRAPSACRWLAEGLGRAGSDVELKNQLQFYNQRCAGVVLDTARSDSARVDSAARAGPGQPADTAKPPASVDSQKPMVAAADTTPRPPTVPSAPAHKLDSTPPAPSAPPAAASPVFRIQIAAVNTRAAADSIVKRVKSGGIDAVIVEEKGLYKVRIGAYPTRAAAAAALPSVRAKLAAQAFVVP